MHQLSNNLFNFFVVHVFSLRNFARVANYKENFKTLLHVYNFQFRIGSEELLLKQSKGPVQ